MLMYLVLIIAAAIGVVLAKTTPKEIRKYITQIMFFRTIVLLSLFILVVYTVFFFSTFDPLLLMIGVLLFFLSLKVDFIQNAILTAMAVPITPFLTSVYVVVESSLMNIRKVLLWMIFFIAFGILLMWNGEASYGSMLISFLFLMVLYDFRNKSKAWLKARGSGIQRKPPRSEGERKGRKRAGKSSRKKAS